MANRHSGSGGAAAVCRAIAEPLAAGLGLRIWDVRFVKEGADWFLRVYIDRDGGVGIDDCVALTRLLSPALDEADPIDQSYCLEVSSPGVERELTRPEHFAAYQGRPVTVRLIRPLDGVREFTGSLLPGEDPVRLESPEGETWSFAKKDIAAVHAVDDWDYDDDEPDESGNITEE